MESKPGAVMAKVLPEQVVQGLIDRGYSPAAAAGIAGNLEHESGFDTAIREINPATASARKQGGGFGLAQWTSADRKNGLYNMASMRGVPVDDLDLQLDYIDHELKTGYKKAYSALKSTDNPRQAAYYFSKHYEKPSSKYAHMDRRMSSAEKFFNMLNPISSAYADETPWQQPQQDIDPNEFAQWEQSQQPDIDPNEFAQWEASQPKEKTAGQQVGEVITDIGGGVLKGASNIGNTLLSAADSYNEFVGNKNALSSLDSSGKERRQQATESLKGMGVDTDSGTYKAAELGTEIAGTAGVGGALGKVAPKMAEALATGGMKGASLAQKAAGGAITGAASAGLVDPETAVTGGVVGAVLPPALNAAGKAGQLVGNKLAQAYDSVTVPQKEKLASKLAELSGKSKDEVIDLLTNKARVAELPGLVRTAPQILQDPTISQIARTVKTNSSMALSQAEQAQQQAYRDALESIAPSNLTVQDAAEKAGGAISDAVKSDYKAATKAVSDKFNELRNNPEKVVTLPLDKLRATVDQYLGRGTVGKGSGAQQALRVAEDLSEVKPLQGVVDDAIDLSKPARAAWHTQPIDHEKDNLLTAITKLGGINKEAAQSTYGNKIWEDVGEGGFNVFKNNGGKSLDEMTEALKEQGYLADHENLNDLVGYLYENPKGMYSMGKQDYANTFEPRSAQDHLHQQLSELIGALNKKNAPKQKAEVLARDLSGKVNFQELQNLRSSIGDLGRQAELAGKNTEAAALKQMVGDIDGRLDDLANNWEGVTPVWLEKYKDARNLHRAKSERFKTGVQAGMFKPKSNGEMLIEGGEIPGKFYSSRASQSRDVQSFKRLVNNSEALTKELKEYALTKAGQTASATGNLGQAYVKWAKTHSGANKELFNKAEKAKIDAVAREIQNANKAENLGRVTGSDTAQKAKSIMDLGLIDNKMVNMLASKLPAGNALLTALKESSGRERSNMLAELLANPDELATVLGKAAKRTTRQAKAYVPGRKTQMLAKTLPLAISQSGK